MLPLVTHEAYCNLLLRLLPRGIQWLLPRRRRGLVHLAEGSRDYLLIDMGLATKVLHHHETVRKPIHISIPAYI